MREHTDLLIYFFLLNMEARSLNDWLFEDGTIPRSVILLFMCIFWRILFTNSDDWLEQLLMWFLRLSHMWWIHFFKLTIEGCISTYFIFTLYKTPKLWWKQTCDYPSIARRFILMFRFFIPFFTFVLLYIYHNNFSISWDLMLTVSFA